MLFSDTYYMQTRQILGATLSAQSLRHSAISQNISNASTPGYKRKDVQFEGFLKRALYGQPKVTSVRADDKHIPFSTEILKIRPEIYAETDSRYRNDENNVDIDREMAILGKNQMSYNAVVSVMQQLSGTVSAVMGPGGRSS